MSRIVSTPLGSGRTRVVHQATGSEMVTDVSPEFGGGGSAFSSTDLVAAALASCIGSSLAVLAERYDIAPTAVEVAVDKEVWTDPKRIGRLPVTVTVAAAADDRLSRSMARAARTCVVHHSLHPDIDSPIAVVFTG